MADQTQPTVYVSPNGETEMPVRSPEMRINLEHRGWTRKDGGQPATNDPTPPAQTDTTPKARPRRQAADE